MIVITAITAANAVTLIAVSDYFLLSLFPFFSPFSLPQTSKAAVHHLTTKFAGELASRSITCNCIAPGFVPSKMSKQLLTYASEDDMRKSIPLQRFAKSEDMAGPALFFASKAAAWVTGTILVVDGGQMSSPPKSFEPTAKL